MRRPYTRPELLRLVPVALKSDSRGPYLRAVAILAIRELFFTLEREDQEELLDELIVLLIADDGADPANTVKIRGDSEVAPVASGESEPCKPSKGSFPH